jgi:hypothetical protein
VPTPLPAEAGFDDPEKLRMEPYSAALESGDGEALMSVSEEVWTGLSAEGLEIVRQPEATKRSAIALRQSFSDNSSQLRADEDALHPENHHVHMNAGYGELVGKDLLAPIAARR